MKMFRMRLASRLFDLAQMLSQLRLSRKEKRPAKTIRTVTHAVVAVANWISPWVPVQNGWARKITLADVAKIWAMKPELHEVKLPDGSVFTWSVTV